MKYASSPVTSTLNCSSEYVQASARVSALSCLLQRRLLQKHEEPVPFTACIICHPEGASLNRQGSACFCWTILPVLQHSVLAAAVLLTLFETHNASSKCRYIANECSAAAALDMVQRHGFYIPAACMLTLHVFYSASPFHEHLVTKKQQLGSWSSPLRWTCH